MRIFVVTNEEDFFSYSFWKSYLESGGIEPEYLCIIENKKKKKKVNKIQKLLQSLILFNPVNSFKIFIQISLENVGLNKSFFKLGTYKTLRHLFKRSNIIITKSINRNPGIEFLRFLKPDVLISVGSPEIFSQELLDIPKIAINVHNGKLPKYRGLFASFWELYNCEKKGYVTIHIMTEQVDCGPIIKEGCIDIKDKGLFDMIYTKKLLGGKMLAQVIKEISERGFNDFYTLEGIKSNKFVSYYSWPSLKESLELKLRRKC